MPDGLSEFRCLLGWVDAAGGDTSSADAKLATCTIKTIFSNDQSYAALCSSGKVVAWGNSDSALPWGNSNSALPWILHA